MAAVANNPKFAKKVGVPQSVGKDFNDADKGKTFKRGGEMATKMDPKMMAMMMAKKRGMGGAGARPSAPPPAPPMGGGMGGGMGMKKAAVSRRCLLAVQLLLALTVLPNVVRQKARCLKKAAWPAKE